MQGIQAKKIAGYMILPGFLPRAHKLFTSGFGYLAFLMATIYSTVRLLPPNHVYLNPENIGKFGIRHVIAEAANHLVIRKENIDQLVIFVALLAATVILLLQFVLLIYSVIIQPALAFSVFDTVNPGSDIAFNLMDKVFGVPGFFCNAAGACTNHSAGLRLDALGPFPPAGDWRSPFQVALHSLFQFYSLGLLLVGVLIFLYFVVVIVAETAVTGTPFGKRFASVWTPIRLVVALGLLVPINYGLNSGQYITLYAARVGSSFATNGWLRFNRTIAESANQLTGSTNRNLKGFNPTGEGSSLVAMPKVQDAASMVEFMTIIHSCAYGYWRLDGWRANIGAADDDTEVATPNYWDDESKIHPYFVKHDRDWFNNHQVVFPVEEGTTFEDALDFYDNSDIIIRFGEFQPAYYPNEKGYVKPLCGDIRIPVSDLSDLAGGTATGGPIFMLWSYFERFKTMWFDDDEFREFALRAMEYEMSRDGDVKANIMCNNGCDNVNLPSCDTWAGVPFAGDVNQCQVFYPGVHWKQNVIDNYQVILNEDLQTAWVLYAQVGANIGIRQEVLDKGWAGAGIWYNRLANLNGAFITAVLNVPVIAKYPLVMEKTREQRRATDSDPSGLSQFSTTLKEGAVQLDGGEDEVSIAKALSAVYQYFHKDGANMADAEKQNKGNIFESGMTMILGLNGLFDMRHENAHTHPLSQLVAVGKGLVEATVRNMGIATGSAFLGGALSALDEFKGVASAADFTSKALMSVSFIGLTAGFILYYVLPFLPFVYFYFAVGSWLKSIFEAMVGVPLWALAHLRIDGEGLSGKSAENGYFLIFEIFLRPILTVFGLIAAITIFAAQVRILNFIWDLVTNNLAGFNDNATAYGIVGNLEFKRAIIDQFFFTIIYTIIVYMLATASFKLIDRIPDNILRWIGAGVSSFSDINQDPAESLTKYAALGGVTMGQQLTGGLVQGARGLGQVTGSALKVGGEAPGGLARGLGNRTGVEDYFKGANKGTSTPPKTK